MVREADVGIVGGVNVGLPILMTMSAFLAIALYNVIEVNFLIFAVFKQRKGLYFWSLLVANWGIAPHAIGFVLKFFQVTTLDLLSSSIVGVGWIGMVLGQSVVLYSRLHLVVQDKTKIRWVLNMIIFNSIVIGCPLIVLAIGANSKHSMRFLPGFMIYDKVQLVVISVQEGIISVIYIYETIRFLGKGDAKRRTPLRKLLHHLIVVNIAVLIFDITLLAIQFSGHYMIQTTYKTAIYSIKLKIEFSVLNRLVSVVKHKNLISTQGNAVGKTLSLGDWTGSKKRQLSTTWGSTNSSYPGKFLKMDELKSAGRESRGIVVDASEISSDDVGTAGLCHDAQHLEANDAEVLPSLNSVHLRSNSYDMERGS